MIKQALLVLSLGFSSTAWAAPSDSEAAAARQLFTSARADERAGRWTDALEKLQRVTALGETAPVLFHIGRCHEELHQFVAAMNDFDRAFELRVSTGDRVEAELERRRASLRARVPTLTLRLPSGISGVKLTVDGHQVTNSFFGNAVPLDPGEHRIAVTAEGRRPYAVTLALPEGTAMVQDVDLPPAIETKSGQLTISPTTPEAVLEEKRERPAKTLVVIGESALALAGAALLIEGSARHTSLSARIANDLPLANGANPGPAACKAPTSDGQRDACDDLSSAEDAKHAADNRIIIGTTMLVAGGIAGVATWLLWSTEGVETHIIERASVSTNGSAIFLRGTF